MAQSSFPADLAVIGAESMDKSWTIIGGGGFGQVFKTRHHQWGWDVAVKIICHDDRSFSDKELLRETELMRRGGCDYVTRVLGIYRGRVNQAPMEYVGLVMDLMERGSLDSLLQKKLKHLPPWSLVFRLAHQVALGMNYLHSLKPALIHKDLKPDNVLLDTGLNVKITDFGLAKFANSNTVTHLKGAMTLFFAPPESWSSKPATCAYDVYSYAILVWTILNPGHKYVQFDVCGGERPSLAEVNRLKAPGLEELVQLMVRCWNQIPEQRPCFKDCIAVTEGLYEKHKRGICDAVYQVQRELDGPGPSTDPPKEPPVNDSLPSVPPVNDSLPSAQPPVNDSLPSVPPVNDSLPSAHFSHLKLNTNTAHKTLSLSENNMVVTRVWGEDQHHPDHPDRFDYWDQVLCREGLTGPCYWEVERNGDVSIAVTYGGISRKGRGDDSLLGYNDKSWSLYCDDNSYIVRHNSKETVLPVRPSGSNRVAVYLDCPLGTLSFYEVCSDSLTHLYTFTFTNTFSEPLYAGFWLSFSSSVRLCEQRQSLSVRRTSGRHGYSTC